MSLVHRAEGLLRLVLLVVLVGLLDLEHGKELAALVREGYSFAGGRGLDGETDR